jgi:hypothetical protein
MRIILLSIAVLFVGILNAQQINPIPDYVFKNQMSVGRNATTDTAAYFSVGPRFGATKGMMPPMVVDTASFSGSKRNGLLIFSVQKNKFLYWDSVRVQWSDMAGSSGQYITGTVTSGKIPKATSATVITDSRVSESGLLVSTPRFKIDSMLLVPKISMTPTDSGAVRYAVADSSLYVWTGSQWVKSLNSTDTTSLSNRINLKVNISDTSTMLSPYIRAAGYGLTKSGQSLLVDTAAMATRARVQKAVDSLGSLVSAGVTGTGVSGYMPEFTSTSVIDTTKLYHTSGKFGIGTTSPVGYLDVIGTKTPSAGEQEGIRVIGSLAARQGLSIGYDSTSADQYGIIASHTGSERTTLNYLAEKHKFTFGQVETAALYIDSIGNVGIGTASPNAKLEVAVSRTSSTNATSIILSDNVTGTQTNGVYKAIRSESNNRASVSEIRFIEMDGTNNNTAIGFATAPVSGGLAEAMRISNTQEVLIATTTDAGDYKLQVAGNSYVSQNIYMNPANSSDYKMYMGTSTARAASGVTGGTLQIVGSPGNAGGITIAGQLSNNAFSDNITFIKSRSTGHTAVMNNDELGGVLFAGSDGTNYLRGALILAKIDGTVGTNDLPTRLEFRTTEDAESVPTTWMILNNAGELLIDENPTDAGAYKLQVDGAIYNTSTITTGAPSGGTAKPFKIGAAATVSPTSPNRTIEIEIEGTTYYIHAKTTNN